jgi:hypothetical protein
MLFSRDLPANLTLRQHQFEQRIKQMDQSMIRMLASLDDELARAFAEEFTAIMIGRDRLEHLASMEKALAEASKLRGVTLGQETLPASDCR